jgi:pimeloyl-ACP methyl ester carboxylesterase
VTYQGWWLDLSSQQIRQLTPVGDGTFTYGPGWQDQAPVQGQLHFSTDAAGIPVRVTGSAPGRVSVDAVRLQTIERSVHFPSQGAVLAGTLSIPPGPGPHPGIVILQGSGALDRHFESISQEIYLSLGFEVLAFDKRGVGASTGLYPGDLATPATIGIEAADAVAAVRFLMAQPGIDARQVGFDANSQGGWVAPLAAEHLPSLRFAILIASPAVTAGQQGLYASFSGGSQYVPAQSARAVDAAVRAASGGYDPAPALAALRIPAIWIYGQLDRQVPVRVSVANLAAYHNPDWTMIVLPGGSHGLIATRYGLDTELADATRFAPGYLSALRAWVAAHISFPE